MLWAVGRHLGSLAGRDLAARCAEGRLDTKGQVASRAERKRALTAECSSRWAGAITRAPARTQYQLAERNLSAEQATLTARVRRIEVAARRSRPAARTGRTRGYATAAERHAKTIRLKALKARLARVAAAGGQRERIGGARSGRRCGRKRGNLAAAGLIEDRWRRGGRPRGCSSADGENGKPWGNETIRWNPEPGWLEIRARPPPSPASRTAAHAATGSLARSGSPPGRRGRRPGRHRRDPLRHQP